MNINDILGMRPVYRVNNREENLRFFREVLGLKVLLEEGSMVELGGHNEKVTKILLEESPVHLGFRETAGIKRHARTVLQADASEIKQLLVRNLECSSRVFKGNRGFAFEVVSPERDVFLVVADDDLEELTEVDKKDLLLELTVNEDFLGLSTLMVKEIAINVAAPSTFIFPQLTEQLADGTDLNATDTWDLESLELPVSTAVDLQQLSHEFNDTYLDAGERILSSKLPIGLELWFEK